MTDLALPFVVAIPAYVVIGFTIFDAARRSDLAWYGKALWIAVAVVLPVFGTLAYLLNRPFRDPGRVVTRVKPLTVELLALLEQHETGAIEDGEFATEKRRIFEAARGR